MKQDVFAPTNRLFKCINGDKSHFRHMLTNDTVRLMTMIEGRCSVAKQPMCGWCERVALWNRGSDGRPVAYCHVCGSTTSNPITYAEYLANGYDIPEVERKSPAGKEMLKVQHLLDAMHGVDRSQMERVR
jgi:hypothetical protein